MRARFGGGEGVAIVVEEGDGVVVVEEPLADARPIPRAPPVTTATGVCGFAADIYASRLPRMAVTRVRRM